MPLTRAAIAQPFLTSLLTLILVAAGVISWSSLPVDLNPQAEIPAVVVTVIFPGAAPATVEQLIAGPLEDALRVVPRARHVWAVCQESVCSLTVDFEVGTPLDEAMANCREATDQARGDLPAEIEEPIFSRLDINAQPVVFLGVIGQRPLEELRRLADDQLKPRLQGIAGVSAVDVLGGRSREVVVAVDRERLVAAGLLMSDLIAPLAASSRNVPGGRLAGDERSLAVRLVGEFDRLADIAEVPVPPRFDPASLMTRPPPAQAPARAVRLGDVATIELTAVDPEVRIRLQQQPAVGVIVSKRGDGNTVAIAREVRAVLRALPAPDDVSLVIARDTAATVAEALADVNASIMLGVLLCAATIFGFLRSVRGTIIVAITIPVCLLGTFAPMALSGNTLNQMTLLGLALSVGILVDDSIVCLESITGRLARGEPAADAALYGRNDIALADTSTTLIDLAVFVPIAVMSGVVGQFFRDFGFVVAVAAALSLLTAYTLVPMLAAVLYRDRPPRRSDERPSRWLRRLTVAYRRTLRVSLRRPALVLSAGWLFLAVTGLVGVRCLGVDFVPAADLSTITVDLELPAGTAAAATERAVARAESLIDQSPEVETLFSTLGRIETGFGIVNRMGPQYAQINVTLRDRRGVLDRLLFRGHDLRSRSDGEVADEIAARLDQLGVARVRVIPVRGWGGAGAPVDLSIYGQDLTRMATVGQELLERLERIDGLAYPDVAWRLGQPEVQVKLDRGRARELYVYPGAVGRELRAAIAGEEGLNLRLQEDTIPIRLRLADTDRRSADDVRRIPVGRTSARQVTIGDVAEVAEGVGPTRIDRRDGLRDLNLKGYLREGVSLGEVRQQIEAITAELGLRYEHGPAVPGSSWPDLRWGWRGDAETLAASAGTMQRTAMAGGLMVYCIMAALFRSAIHPLTIMLSIPMAISGALLLLLVTGSSMSIVSGIGMILLISIVVRNAVLLVDCTLQLRAAGTPRDLAIEQAGVRRLRPILMTTLTTVLGMLPIALRIGKGAEIRAPMAIAVIGGLCLSTLLTLVIVPVTYRLFDHLGERWRALRAERVSRS